MNRTLALLSALGVGLSTVAFTGSAAAQAAAAPPAPAAAQPAPKPEAIPVKIGLIFFQQGVIATNEGQKVEADLAKKYEPQRNKIMGEANDLDNLKKQLQAAPATMADAEKSKMATDIDARDKQLQLDQETFNNSVNAEMQEGLSKVAEKFSLTMNDYAQKNGFTMLMDAGSQQSTIMWLSPEAHIDITQAVIDAYNKTSGVAGPAPAAPAPAAAAKPRTPPSSTAPRSTPPKPATPATK